MQKLGRHKKAYLEGLKMMGEITPEQLEILNKEYKRLDKSDHKGVSEYFDKIKSEKVIPSMLSFDEKYIFEKFKEVYLKNQGVEFIENLNTLTAYYTLMYYFLGSKRFYDSPLLSNVSNPDLKKGICLVGGYGVGKSSMIKTFWKLARGTKQAFTYYHAGRVIELFEAALKGKHFEELINSFYKKMEKPFMCFDDVKTEEVLKAYGETRNTFKHILESRNDKGLRTIITCNYKEGQNGDLNAAIAEFGEKYGSRVYDRMFSDFNFIEMNWKSFRR